MKKTIDNKIDDLFDSNKEEKKFCEEIEKLLLISYKLNPRNGFICDVKKEEVLVNKIKYLKNKYGVFPYEIMKTQNLDEYSLRFTKIFYQVVINLEKNQIMYKDKR